MKIKGFLCLTLSFALLLGESAQAQTIYQIELIAFARNDNENEENWDRKLELRYPQRYINLQPNDGSGASFQLLGPEVMQLNKEAAAIAGRRHMRVLLHAAWRQSGDNSAQAAAVILNGGKPFGAHHELEGTFTLSVERFLRADVNLWLSRFSNDVAAVSAQTLPNPPGSISDPTDGSHYVATQTVLLKEQRRLRSGELHYFDHPRLGLILLVTPVDPQ